jgi:hypothetical protein
MRKLLLIVAALLGLTAPSWAQNTTGLVVGTCGSPPVGFNASTSTFAYPGPFTVDTSGKLCVNASVSASVNPFGPPTAYTHLTATGSSSASTALPSNSGSIVITNEGTTPVSCTLASGSATAVVDNIVVAPGNGGRNVGTSGVSNIACIDQNSGDSTSNLVVIEGGSGLGTGWGGGSGGGGGGGTSSSFGSSFPATGTAIGLTNGTNMVAWSATSNYGTAPSAIPVPAVNAYVTNATSLGQTVANSSNPVVLASNQSVADPCTFQAKTSVSFSTGMSGTQLIPGSSGKHTYICHEKVLASAAANYSLVAGSGSSVCTGGTPYALTGSTTASAGLAFPANGGDTAGDGQGTIMSDLAAAASGYNICILINGTANLAGNLTYVQAP